MLKIQIKESEEFIFQSKFISAPTIWIGIILYCLFCTALFAHRPSTAYAAESSPFTSGRSKKDLFSDKERSKIIKKYLKIAKEYYKEGRYDEAIKFWNKVLTFDPDNPRAKEGIETAGEKIAKIKDFFGRDLFGVPREISKFSLQNCIEIAEERSLLIQIAKEQINLSKIKVWEARRAFLPSLTLSWAETKGIRTAGKTEGIEYGIEGKQPAFRSGELMYTLTQSKANLKITEKNYDRVRLELYFEVAEAYYTFVKAKQFLEYTKALYEDTKPLYEMAQKKYEKRVVPDIEYLNSESKYNQIYYKSISAESDFELAKLALEQKLDIEERGIDVELDIIRGGVDKDIDTCLSLAMENRPDLRMSELTVKSTEYGEKIAQAKELPRVDLTGHYKNASEVYKKDFNWTTRDEARLDPKKKWYAGVEVNWPFLGSTGTYSLYKKVDPPTISTYYGASETKGTIWQLGILDNLGQFSETKEAEITRVRAEEELNDMRKKVVMEVKEAFYGYEKSRIQLEAAGVQKEFSEKEGKILKLKHSLGEIELSELFESLVRVMDANEAYFEAEKDLDTSTVALNKAIGLEDYF